MRGTRVAGVGAMMIVTCVGGARALGGITVATVPVGNAGNAADTRTDDDGTTGYGGVAYAYRIGTYEVTNSQYTAFLNAVGGSDFYGLYSIKMPGISRAGDYGSYTYTTVDGRGDLPVTYVSWGDAARFANWLHNGQPTGEQNNGTTEDGAYTLTAAGITNCTVTRNAGATWALPSENEWYKAAYYQPAAQGGFMTNYWLFPISDNAIAPEDANYRSGTMVGDTKNVGSYDANFYGTYDMAGNVFEWNEAALPGKLRGIRGGSFVFSENFLKATRRESAGPLNEGDDTGFRVVQLPGPGTLGLLAICGVAGVRRRR